MKKIHFSIILFFVTINVFAQSPQAINYQAVIRNSNGTTVNNIAISLRLTIIQGTANGTPVYAESHTQTTSNIGLVNVVLGQGTVIAGNFGTINWSNGPYFLEVSSDITGGSNYTVMGSQQMMSVPYSLNSKYAEISGNGVDSVSFLNDTLKLYLNNGSEKSVFMGTTTVNNVSIGDYYQGGYVFYLDPNSTGGLIVMPTDLMNYSNTSSWTDANTICNNVKCNGYTDWYLPSLSELLLIYNNLGNAGFREEYWSTSTATNIRWYWSSTSFNSTASYGVNFENGTQAYWVNSTNMRIRGIRSFTF